MSYLVDLPPHSIPPSGAIISLPSIALTRSWSGRVTASQWPQSCKFSDVMIRELILMGREVVFNNAYSVECIHLRVSNGWAVYAINSHVDGKMGWLLQSEWREPKKEDDPEWTRHIGLGGA